MQKVPDSLGDRMKSYYENRFRHFLPRRTYTLIRVDGKAFHTYTRNLPAPFDDSFMDAMDQTAVKLCQEIQGAKLAFVQSDEISVVLTDFDELTTQAWFDHNLQKMVSVSASIATAEFNRHRLIEYVSQPSAAQPLDLNRFTWAEFDSRVFQIPTKTEVENYLIWRQQDTVRNSLSAVAQSLYNHKELQGQNGSQLQELIFRKGINWNDYAPRYKRGRVIQYATYEKQGVVRGHWRVTEPPIFTQDRTFLDQLIPDQV